MVCKIAKHHLESFNFACGEGLGKLIEDIQPVEFELSDGSLCTLKFEDANIGLPSYANKSSVSHGSMKLMPGECRLSRCTYNADLKINISWYINGLYKGSISRIIGKVPIMIKSNYCHLAKITMEEELMRLREEFSEFGGYFIINGIEKLIRPILIPRRNFPIALVRPTWKRNGICFTEYGLTVYSVRNEHTYANFIMHYLSNGSVMLSLFFQNQKFLLPLIPVLKALSNMTDKQMYVELTKGSDSRDDDGLEKFYRSCVLNMLRKAASTLPTATTIGSDPVPPLMNESSKAYALIGSRFRAKVLVSTNRQSTLIVHPHHVITHHVRSMLERGIAVKAEGDGFAAGLSTPTALDPNYRTELENEMIGRYLLSQSLLINLDADMDKFYFLAYMTRKLFAFAKHRCLPESIDGPMMQEVLLPGQIFLVVLKQKLTDWLQKLKLVLLKRVDLLKGKKEGSGGAGVKKRLSVKADIANIFGKGPGDIKPEFGDEADTKDPLITVKMLSGDLMTPELVSQCLSSVSSITRPIEYFYSTGNLVLREATSIQQTAGFTIIAEKINYIRYLSHFRSVHRGSHFAKTRISSIRKLTPDSWGYLCAVHTPDGAPCGLLNHMTATCEIVSYPTHFRSLRPIPPSSQDAGDPAGRNSTQKRVKFHATTTDRSDPQGIVGGEESASSESITYDEYRTRTLNAVRCVMFVKPEPGSAGAAHCCKGPDQTIPPYPLPEKIYDGTKSSSYHYPVFLDSILIGWVPEAQAPLLETRLRLLKGKKSKQTRTNHPRSAIDKLGQGTTPLELPYDLEIVFIKRKEHNAQFPGFFIFSTFSRLVRPVRNITTNGTEYVGSFEQIYLHIAVEKSEITDQTNHVELSPAAFLSLTANLIPFSDFNQSPRNMYQCQMCKQTMGTTHYSLPYKAENKSYRLQNPQAPLVRCASADDDNWVKDYPSGTNAIVAVISYTGYDMEDAMVINRASEQRGFAHGFVYKTEVLDLTEIVQSSAPSFETPNAAAATTALTTSRRDHTCLVFGYDAKQVADPFNKLAAGTSSGEEFPLDSDGLPHVGALISEGTPYYSYINIVTGKCKVVKYKGTESFVVDQVYIVGDDDGLPGLRKALIYLRMKRNATIGDKFASRQGQKGICSYQLAQENMPFTESGLVPDIIFNPHGFPSRMTIGMMIECMAGKSSALLGEKYDATPFIFDEKNQASKYFGDLLTKSGYDYYGTEIMYSGNDGRMLEVDIFFGVIYYQRLRHMVADKYQVRTTGPVDSLTHQPLKGRKRAGGIRCGEMERDALIAHGTSFLLQDRLLNCSDVCFAEVCTKCKSLLSPMHTISAETSMSQVMDNNKVVGNKRFDKYSSIGQKCKRCRLCGSKCVTIRIPYVLKYLLYELMAINIKLELDVRSIC